QAEQAQIWRCARQRLLLTTTGSCLLKEFSRLGEIVNRGGAFVGGLTEALSVRLAQRVDLFPQFGDEALDVCAAIQWQLAHDKVDGLDAVSAFVDRSDARIAQKRSRAGFFDEAHAAMHLHADGSDLNTDIG